MKKTILIGVVVVIAAITLGIGAAAGAAYFVRSQYPQMAANVMPGWGSWQGNAPYSSNFDNSSPYGRPMMGNGYGNGMGRGLMMRNNGYGNGPMMGNNYGGGFGRGPMMGNRYGYGSGGGQTNQQPSGQRISIDTAVQNAQTLLTGDDNLKISEIMEFENNCYVVVVEKDSGKGAFELLVDPWSGTAYAEPGPNRMWNLKYGHMGNLSAPSLTQNAISLDQAKEKAQEYLDANNQGAKTESNGLEFYGYYTFDYEMDGKIGGMLSVNSQSGQVWLHTWHGNFVSEKELTE